MVTEVLLVVCVCVCVLHHVVTDYNAVIQLYFSHTSDITHKFPCSLSLSVW